VLSNASGGKPARASLHAAVRQVASRDPIIAGLVPRVGCIKRPPVYNALALAREMQNVGLPDEVAEKSALPA